MGGNFSWSRGGMSKFLGNGVTPLSRKSPGNSDLETEKRNRSGFPRKTLVSPKVGKNGLK